MQKVVYSKQSSLLKTYNQTNTQNIQSLQKTECLAPECKRRFAEPGYNYDLTTE